MVENTPKMEEASQEIQPLTEGEKAKNDRWNEILAHLTYWFYKPDMDALAIALSVYSAHVLLDSDPVWLFVVGTSGSGKTSIICNALACLPSTMLVSDVTPTSFISGRAVKDGGSSLLFQLPQIGKDKGKKNGGRTQGVLVFKDFTSILARKYETKQEIIAVMREIYDGKYAPKKGTKTMDWSGKVSVVAAVTSAIERASEIQRDLGERFVQVRWPREDGVATADKAADQVDHSVIINKLTILIKNLIGVETLPTKVSPPDKSLFTHLAELVAVLRGPVIRANGKIIDVPEPEAPTRIMQAMMQITMGHARIFRRGECNERDVKLGRRVGFDSIPLNRLKVFDSVGLGATQAELVKGTGLQFSSIEYVCEELVALGVLQGIINGSTVTYKFTEEFAKKRANALGDDYPKVLDFKKGGPPKK